MSSCEEAKFFLARQENSYRGFLLSQNPYYIERIDKHRSNFKARLGTAQSFAQEATAFVDWLRQSPPGAGFEGVQIAGEPERAYRRERAATGIVVDDQTWQEIVQAGRKVGRAIN